MGKFNSATTARFLKANNIQSADFSQHLMSDVSTGMELLAENALAKWQETAQEIRKLYGKDSIKSAVYAPATH